MRAELPHETVFSIGGGRSSEEVISGQLERLHTHALDTHLVQRRLLGWRVKLQKVAKEYGELPHALPALASGMRERRKEDEASARVLLEKDLTPVLAQNPQRRRATRQ